MVAITLTCDKYANFQGNSMSVARERKKLGIEVLPAL
jgi:hypothetical protein